MEVLARRNERIEMWILPKSITSVYVPATEASTLDSEAFSQQCEQSLMWRSKPSLRGTWLRRWKANNWMKHLCGRTLKPSMHDHFVDSWTSSLADSHVNHSAMQGSKKVQMIQDICSQTSNELSWSVNQESSSSKMSKGLFPLSMEEKKVQVFSSMSWEDWRRWVTEQRQAYSVRRNAARLIKGSECSSSRCPTPTASDAKGSRRSTAAKPHWKSVVGDTLTDVVQTNWPTPDVMQAHRAGVEIDPENWKRQQAEKAKQGINKQFHINVAVNWPTPTGIHADRGNHDEPLENYNKRVKDYEDGRAKGKPGKSLGVAVRQTKTWATPQVTDSTRGDQIRKPNELTDAAKGGGCRNLQEDVVNWPTPTASTGGGSTDKGNPRGKNSGNPLKTAVENWPTPTTRDHKDTAKNPEDLIRFAHKKRLACSVAASQHTPNNPNTSGKPQEQLEVKRLSPLWVAQLMALPTATWCVPVDWILCDYSETE